MLAFMVKVGITGDSISKNEKVTWQISLHLMQTW